jgi:RNA polymerase sigma-70 factor (ECF subfamily)
MEPDERLYERLQRGELAAFELLYERYERRLFGFVLTYVGDRQEAEDLFHEAFLGVLRSRQVEFSAGSFRSWLYQIARNLCLNRLRARARGERARRTVEAATGPERSDVQADVQPDVQIERREATVALTRAIARLPTGLSELYHLRAAGMSYEEMARVLAIPLGTVKSRMHQMMAQLQKEMRPWSAG